MTRRHLLFALTLLTLPPCARAEQPITLTEHVLFTWRMRHDEHGQYGVCGFAILGNQTSRADPKVVYDINLDQIFNGAERIAGVNIATFDVVHGKRSPRAPATALSFSFEGGGEALAAVIIGAPGASGIVQGTLDLERSTPLFQAFAFDRSITINVKYADGRAETLRTHGFRAKYDGEKLNPFVRCTQGEAPLAGARIGSRIQP